jgi:hypothetical protein
MGGAPGVRIPGLVEGESGKAGRVAALALAEHGEQARTDLGSIRHTAEQVMGDWFPGEV